MTAAQKHARRPGLETAALVAVLAVAFALRCWGISFGLPHTQARPDESRIVNLALNIATGDLNPHYFVYPTLYMYLLAAVFKAEALVRGLAVAALPYEDLLLTGRIVTATFGTATVWVAYALGRRAGGAITGLAAGLLLSVVFLHVRDSHFATTDVPMTCLVSTSVLMLLASRPSTPPVGAAGLVAGLAASVKYNAVLLVFVALALEVHGAVTGAHSWRRSLQRVCTFSLCMVAGFLAGTPYALVEGKEFAAGASFVLSYLTSGHTHEDQVLAVPDAARHYLGVVLPKGIGWGILLAGAGGMLLCFRSNVRTALGLMLFPVVYFLTAARGETVFARYMIPTIPFLCVAAAYAVDVAAAVPRSRSVSIGVTLVLLVVLTAPMATKTIRLDALLATRDNRLIAADWIDARLSGKRVCETGSRYGRVHTDRDTGLCPDPSDPPEYVVLQRSPLKLYSALPATAEAILHSRYRLIQTFKTGLGTLREQDYDASDAFFIPLDHLDAIRRPGPEFDVYELRRD